MAAPSTTWDVSFDTAPADSADPEYGADAIRDFKLAIRERVQREHVGTTDESTADKTYDGLHRKGSARVYAVDADPKTAWPDADALTRSLDTADDTDDGRLWIDTGDGNLPAVWVQTASTPSEVHGWQGCIREVFEWTWQGVVATTLSVPPILIPHACTILKIGAVLKTGPTGSATKIKVYKNGVATNVILSDGTLDVPAGAGTQKISGTSFDATNKVLAADDYLNLGVTAVGSTTAGADLRVYVEVVVHP